METLMIVTSLVVTLAIVVGPVLIVILVNDDLGIQAVHSVIGILSVIGFIAVSRATYWILDRITIIWSW